jgi:hypothetical protein
VLLWWALAGGHAGTASGDLLPRFGVVAGVAGGLSVGWVVGAALSYGGDVVGDRGGADAVRAGDLAAVLGTLEDELAGCGGERCSSA